MTPILCNPFKKNNKIVPSSTQYYNNLMPKYSKPDKSNITNLKKDIKSDNYDNTVEKIYVKLLDNEKRLKHLNFSIDRLDTDIKTKMDILYEIEKKLDLYDLKFNKILHIR